MNEPLITPFINSTTNVFETMLGCTPEQTDLIISDSFQNEYDVTGVIGLSGQASGTVVVSLEREVALSAASAMLCEPHTEINDHVIDVVGELTNMIAGHAKSALEQFEMHLALPTVITGDQHAVRFASLVKPAIIFFESDWGKFTIEVAISENATESRADKTTVEVAC